MTNLKERETERDFCDFGASHVCDLALFCDMWKCTCVCVCVLFLSVCIEKVFRQHAKTYFWFFFQLQYGKLDLNIKFRVFAKS